MSCYFRHIKEIMDEAGVEVTPETKKQIDQAIHEAVGVNYKDCPAVWKRLKERLAGDEQERRVLVKAVQDSVR